MSDNAASVTPSVRTGYPPWVRSPWFTWSWLLVLAAAVLLSLDYHWRQMPTDARGYFARGRADFLLGEFESAAENFSKSIALDPEDAESYIWRGESYVRLGDFARGTPDLEKALAMKPAYAKSHAGIADEKAAQWDTEGAIREFGRAIELDANYGRCYLERGKLFYDQERWDDAARDLRQASRLVVSDNDATARFLLWSARARAGEAAGATDELCEAVGRRRILGDRFSATGRFLCDRWDEKSYFAAVAANTEGDPVTLKAEALFLAGVKRLAFGDQAGGLAMMRQTLSTDADSSYAYGRARVELERQVLGVRAMRLGDAARKQFALGPDAGLAIAAVVPGGPGDAAGLKPASIVAAINGEEASQDNWITMLESATPRSDVRLQLIDGDGSRRDVSLSLRPETFAPTR